MSLPQPLLDVCKPLCFLGVLLILLLKVSLLSAWQGSAYTGFSWKRLHSTLRTGKAGCFSFWHREFRINLPSHGHPDDTTELTRKARGVFGQ